ncbi:MAG: PhaM family polyhydroxyalkanoate granule multifunctional regulatory protein [Comamonas sp.]
MMQDMASGFNPFAPGFDFLKQLTEGKERLASSQFPQWADWVAPTMNVQELDKRISELKTIQFWLEQNQRALAATIQALEVQKMTLATLQTMNVPMENMAASMVQSWRNLASSSEAAPAAEKTANPYSAAFAAAAAQAPAEAAAPAEAPQAASTPAPAPAADTGTASTVDAMQWWGALTQQFQQIASQAIQDVTQRTMAQAAASNQAAAESAAGVMQAAKQAQAGMAANAPAAPARKTAASGAKKAAASPAAGAPKRSTAAAAKSKSSPPKPRSR